MVLRWYRNPKAVKVNMKNVTIIRNRRIYYMAGLENQLRRLGEDIEDVVEEMLEKDYKYKFRDWAREVKLAIRKLKIGFQLQKLAMNRPALRNRLAEIKADLYDINALLEEQPKQTAKERGFIEKLLKKLNFVITISTHRGKAKGFGEKEEAVVQRAKASSMA